MYVRKIDRALCFYRRSIEVEFEIPSLEAQSIVKIQDNDYGKKCFFFNWKKNEKAQRNDRDGDLRYKQTFKQKSPNLIVIIVLNLEFEKNMRE